MKIFQPSPFLFIANKCVPSHLLQMHIAEVVLPLEIYMKKLEA